MNGSEDKKGTRKRSYLGSSTLAIVSLVPRPFPPPVFDGYCKQKRRGKAWEKKSRA